MIGVSREDKIFQEYKELYQQLIDVEAKMESVENLVDNLGFVDDSTRLFRVLYSVLDYAKGELITIAHYYDMRRE